MSFLRGRISRFDLDLAHRRLVLKRKPFKPEVDPEAIQEISGFKLGDTVHCLRHPDKTPSRGTITKIHSGTDVTGPYFSFLCDATGQFRYALLSQSSLDPDEGLRASIEKEMTRSRRQDAAIVAKMREKEKEKEKG